MSIRYGFIGLGAMGAPIAGNLVAAGEDVIVFDIAGTEERAPADATIARDLPHIAKTADCIFLSLPDGAASATVADDLSAVGNPIVTVVIDLSTVGIAAAQAINATYTTAGIAHIDAPVSGGQAGAKAATLSIMWGGPTDVLFRHRPALAAISKHVFHVGDEPGQGQAMKLLNNYLSAAAMAATSEAITFGVSRGLDMSTMLKVLNASTGQNQATSDKFPKRIATGTFDAGFRTELMTKDLSLYVESVAETDAPSAIVGPLYELWRAADSALPGSDFTQIYQYVSGQCDE